MDQSAIQSGVQDTIQALSAFADADVVINDRNVLDQSITNAPYVVIENVRNARIAEGPGGQEHGTLELPFTIYEAFVTYPDSLNNLRNREDAVINGFNGNDWTASGITGVNIEFVRLEQMLNVYDVTVDRPEFSDPVYLARPCVLEMRLF